MKYIYFFISFIVIFHFILLCNIFFTGCKVIIASRSIEKLNTATKELEHLGDIKPLQCNIRKEEDIK